MHLKPFFIFIFLMVYIQIHPSPHNEAIYFYNDISNIPVQLEKEFVSYFLKNDYNLLLQGNKAKDLFQANLVFVHSKEKAIFITYNLRGKNLNYTLFQKIGKGNLIHIKGSSRLSTSVYFWNIQQEEILKYFKWLTIQLNKNAPLISSNVFINSIYANETESILLPNNCSLSDQQKNKLVDFFGIASNINDQSSSNHLTDVILQCISQSLQSLIIKSPWIISKILFKYFTNSPLSPDEISAIISSIISLISGYHDQIVENISQKSNNNPNVFQFLDSEDEIIKSLSQNSN